MAKKKSYSHVQAAAALEQLAQRGVSASEFGYELLRIFAGYLMRWFRRPKFERYAWFKSHDSAREVFDWDEMCEVRLPIPLSSLIKDFENRLMSMVALVNSLNNENIVHKSVINFYFPNYPNYSYGTTDKHRGFAQQTKS